MESYRKHTPSRDVPSRNADSRNSGPEQEGAIQDMVRRFNQIRADNPHLRGYMTGDPINAGGILGRVGRFLAQNPRIIEDLNEIHSHNSNPDQFTMAIVPDFHLVVAKDGNQTYALVTTLSCTLNAIYDLFKDKPRARNQYDIFVSPNGLIDRVWKMAEAESKKNSRAVLNYKRGEMKPEDYVALAAQGAFSNELFRQKITPK